MAELTTYRKYTPVSSLAPGFKQTAAPRRVGAVWTWRRLAGGITERQHTAISLSEVIRAKLSGTLPGMVEQNLIHTRVHGP
jgi:hypothetical protein